MVLLICASRFTTNKRDRAACVERWMNGLNLIPDALWLRYMQLLVIQNSN